MRDYIGIIKRRFKKWFILDPQDTFVSRVSESAPWAYVSYVVDSFYHRDDDFFLDSHQNKRESIEIVKQLNQRGYNVYVQGPKSKRKLPSLDISVVFGIEPNFIKASKKYPRAIKIYYATGAYANHQNRQVKRMTDYINKQYNGNVRYARLVPPHASPKIADKILQIGSRYTIDTYPEKLREKITLIHQSTQSTIVLDSVSYSKENEFFFMSSTGNALKGLSLLIEYFSKHNNLVLNVVGPIEEEFKNALSCIISTNIIFWGFVNVNSQLMRDIMSRCNFIVYPSGSEGVPGAVLNSMKNGLIPITTPWAAVDGIEQLGYIIQTWDIQGVEEGMNWALSLSEMEIFDLKKQNNNSVVENYTLDVFKKELSNFFDRISK